MSDRPAAAPWRAVIFTAFVPAVLNATGRGAIMPIIPVVAVAAGADLAMAGFISALILVGGLLGDLPSGPVVVRFGERNAMIGAAGVSVLGSLIAVLIPHPIALAVGVLVIGMASAVFALARQAYITTYVPVAYRARALSTLGGSYRLGMAAGPFVTVGLLAIGAPAISAFWVLVAGSGLGALVLIVVRDGTEDAHASPRGASASHAGLWRTIRMNGRVLATAGTGSAVMAGLRASRQVILPLWAVAIGMDEATASVVIGVSMALDFALFYLSGWMMDRFGRVSIAIPSLVALSLGHLLLALSFVLDHRDWWFVGAAVWLALANGIGAGVLMTLGSDLADPSHPAPFLGAWRFTNDSGGTLAPLALATLTAAASLPVAAIAMGGLGLAGALLWQKTLPRAIAAREAERAEPTG